MTKWEVSVDARMASSSGIGRYVRELTTRLVSVPEISWNLMGGRQALPATAAIGSGTGTRLIPLRAPIYTLREQWELKNAIPPDSDLVWSPHYNIPLFWRGRLLVTVHDVLHLAEPRFVPGVHRRAYARLMFAAVARRATHVICVSKHTADELMRHTGLAASRITVVHNGVTPLGSGDASLPVTERPYILAVGNVKPHKNLGVLLDAFAVLRDEIPHDLIIVGRMEGFRTGDAEVIRRAEAMEPRVKLVGEISDEALGTYLSNAGALVFPSLYEGFGLPPLEAMAAGCPVVCSDAASLPEVCGDAALLFDAERPEELVVRLRALLGDPRMADDLRTRGRQRAVEFSWERCAAETRQVLERVLEG